MAKNHLDRCQLLVLLLLLSATAGGLRHPSVMSQACGPQFVVLAIYLRYSPSARVVFCNPRAATHHAAEGETCSSYLSNRPNGRRSQPQVKGHSSEPQSITPKGKKGTRSHQGRQQTQRRPKGSRVRVHTASTRRNWRCNCTPLKVKEPTHGRKSMLPHGLIRKEGLGSLIANRLSN